MNQARNSKWGWLFLALGFFFLYAPMLSLIIYSFNENRLVTVWSGFSTKWYGALLEDDQMLSAAWVSLRIAFYTACASVVLGTMAAMVMTRLRAFRGKTLFAAMVTAPLVMPEVITGLSILLQVNNLTNSPYVTRQGNGFGDVLAVERYDTYGRQVLLGVSYKL